MCFVKKSSQGKIKSILLAYYKNSNQYQRAGCIHPGRFKWHAMITYLIAKVVGKLSQRSVTMIGRKSLDENNPCNCPSKHHRSFREAAAGKAKGEGTTHVAIDSNKTYNVQTIMFPTNYHHVTHVLMQCHIRVPCSNIYI